MVEFPESHLDLLEDGTRAFAYLGTLMADGSPQATPVWFNSDGMQIFVNSARGRIKDRNMRARPSVVVLIADPADPYRYMQVRGRITEITEKGALEHINALSMKYRGKPWTRVADQVRVIFKLTPEHISVG